MLFSLLAVVRGQSSPEEKCVLSAAGIITQLWSRMSPDQVRPEDTHTHTAAHTENTTVNCGLHDTLGADPPCAAVYFAAPPVVISSFGEKH